MPFGPGPKWDWAPGPNEIRTWDKMRISEVVEVRGEGDSVGYGCHGIAAILSILFFFSKWIHEGMLL